MTPYQDKRPHTSWEGQISDSYPGLMGLPHLLRRPTAPGARHSLSPPPLPGSNPPGTGGSGTGEAPPAAPWMSPGPWALLLMGAHSHACPQRSARNPKQHSWVGRREGPAVSGTPNSFLPGSLSAVTWDPRRCRERLQVQPPAPYRDQECCMCF